MDPSSSSAFARMRQERRNKKRSGGVEKDRRRSPAAAIPTKVCAIISQGVQHGVYWLDLDKDCDGDEGFVRKDPNLLIGNVPFRCYCGLDRSIYMFDGLTRLDAVCSEVGKDRNGIYRLDLWPGISDYTNCIIDRTTLPLIARMQSPKVLPAAVRFRGGIVVFSTHIPYYNTKPPYPYYITKPPSPDVCDFEILTHHENTKPLPQLRIRLVPSRSWTWVKPDCHFVLLSSSSETEGECVTPRYSCGRDELRRPSFRIIAFSVIEHHMLVVQTDFAGLFCLDLDVPCAEWKEFQGPPFPLCYENFVTKNSDLVMCASGASKFSNAGVGDCEDDGGDGGADVDVSFPLSASVYPDVLWRNFAMGLPERTTYPKCFPCVLYTDQPKWTLDFLRVDVSKFNEERQDKGNARFARRIKSFRFESDYHGISFTPMLLYPF